MNTTIDGQRRCIPTPSALRGFTLVELLVVVGIISVLVAMLLPALNKARQQALRIACASNMKQIWMAIHSYSSDWKGATPPLCYDDSDTFDPNDPSMNWIVTSYGLGWGPPSDSCGGAGFRAWPTLLWKYHKNNKVYICPNANYQKTGWTYELNPNFCPSWIYGNGGYTNNPGGSGAGLPGNALVPIDWCHTYNPPAVQYITFKLTAFQYKEDKILLTEGMQGFGYNNPSPYFWPDRWWSGLGVLGGTMTNGAVVTWNPGGGGGIDANHRGFANCLMLDGSVQSFDGKKPMPLNDAGTPPSQYSWWRPDRPSYH